MSSSREWSFDEEDAFRKDVHQSEAEADDKENCDANRDVSPSGNIFLDSETDFRLLLRATETQNFESGCSEQHEPSDSAEASIGEALRGIKRQGDRPESEDARPEKSQRRLDDDGVKGSVEPTSTQSLEEDGGASPREVNLGDESTRLVEEGSRTERDVGTGSPRLSGSQVHEDPVLPVHLGSPEKADVMVSKTEVTVGMPVPSLSTHLAEESLCEDPDTDSLGDLVWPKESTAPGILSGDTLPPPTEETQPFKVPSEMALVCVTIRASDVNKVTRFIGGLTDQKMFVQSGRASDMLHFFSKITSFCEASQRRVSDVSSLSSHSRFSSATGYSADVGSVGSTTTSGSSVSSKRDRHSLCPDLAIEKHSVVSPLPKLASKLLANDHKDALTKLKVQQLSFIGEESESEKPTQVVNLDVDNLCLSKDDTTTGPKEIGTTGSGHSGVSAVVAEPPLSESKQRAKRLFSRHTRDTMSKLASPSVRCEDPDDEHLVNFSNEIKVSSRVFAKWIERSDIRYWPGKVESITDEKYFILFDDGFSRNLKEEDLIRIDALKPGFEVNVSVEEDEGIFQTATIVSHPDLSKGKSSKAEVSYMVEFSPVDNVSQPETKLVSSSLIHLSDIQAKEIKQELGGKYTMPKMRLGDLSLDNLVSTPRRTRISTPAKLGKTPSNRDSIRKKGGDNAETSVTEEVESSPNGSVMVGKEQFSTEDEGFCASAKKSRKKKKSEETLFGGMIFVLTQGKQRHEQYVASTMDTETEEEDCLESISPLSFNKSEIRKTLEMNGGHVLKEFPGSKQKIPEEIILISDKHCLTMNYLSCIVYGFKLINFTWVLNCVATKTRLPLKSYYLTVGNSTLLTREIEQKEIGNLRNLFKDNHILLASTKKEFIADWKPVLSRMGAATSSRSTGSLDKSLSAIDVLIGDTPMPTSIMKDARSKKIPIVSSLWVIECIINGKRVPFGNFLL